jgi:glycosyltransferase involved in cell wall biosynthesis
MAFRVKVSVLIPAYNAEATIKATLDSVLSQTRPPDEIIVLDDGSTDNTASLVGCYRPRVTLFRQKNAGVASARNALCQLARGNFLAFLDHDDIWHSNYLEVQEKLSQTYPDASAFFTGHVDFKGYTNYVWKLDPICSLSSVELLDPLEFFERYNQATGSFASMSYCCIPKCVLSEIGCKPFRVSGVDDSYFCDLLALLGRPVVFAPVPLVAYRLTTTAQSANHLKTFSLWVKVFQMLEARYREAAKPDLLDAFTVAFASKRRQYAKLLMGTGNVSEARTQLCHSLRNSGGLLSMAKSIGLLFLSYLPSRLQPTWPSSHRKS